jgi:hypothetical protein
LPPGPDLIGCETEAFKQKQQQPTNKQRRRPPPWPGGQTYRHQGICFELPVCQAIKRTKDFSDSRFRLPLSLKCQTRPVF